MAEKVRAGRNRTITLNDFEQQIYFSQCKTTFGVNSVICNNVFDIANNLPNEFVDLLIVDPPYNLSKQYGENLFKKMNNSEYRDFTEKWLQSIKHTLKKTASIYVCCDWKSSLIIGDILQKYFYIQNRITWQREKGRGALSNWKNSMEDIWFATVSNNYTFNVDDVKMRRKVVAPYKIDGKPKDWQETENGNFRDTYPSNFWDDISIPYWSMPENTEHHTQKPEKLIAKLVLASSNKGEVIFDPFLGSGTTAVVAKKLGRRFIGIEIEPQYCAIAIKRLALADNDNAIQGYTNNIFWERNSLNDQQKCVKDKTSAIQVEGNTIKWKK